MVFEEYQSVPELTVWILPCYFIAIDLTSEIYAAFAEKSFLGHLMCIQQ